MEVEIPANNMYFGLGTNDNDLKPVMYFTFLTLNPGLTTSKFKSIEKGDINDKSRGYWSFKNLGKSIKRKNRFN